MASPDIITSNRSIALRRDDGTVLTTLHIETVTQRNWSRVACAATDAPLPGQVGDRVFVKQFVDAAQAWHPPQWEYERDGVELARRVLAQTVHVPTLLHVDAQHLLHVYEYIELLSIDELLRGETQRLQRVFPKLLETMREVLARSQEAGGKLAADPATQLAVKTRPFGGASDAVNFKGMDIRNVGLDAAGGGRPAIMFDFGRPYLAPIEESGAKLLVSIGLLNWGRPVHRFVRGPDESLLDAACKALADYLDFESVLAEIEYQRRTREGNVKAPNFAILALKMIGVRTIGRIYIRRLTAWSRRHLGGKDQ